VAEAISKRIPVLASGREREEKATSAAEDVAREVNRNLIFLVLMVALVFVGCSSNPLPGL
jgi:hypothetical protein